jgi:hypothetical protein
MGTTQKAARKPSMKAIDRVVEKAFGACSQGLQFNIMDLGKIHAAGVHAYQAGEDVTAAVRAACQTYSIKAS